LQDVGFCIHTRAGISLLVCQRNATYTVEKRPYTFLKCNGGMPLMLMTFSSDPKMEEAERSESFR